MPIGRVLLAGDGADVYSPVGCSRSTPAWRTATISLGNWRQYLDDHACDSLLVRLVDLAITTILRFSHVQWLLKAAQAKNHGALPRQRDYAVPWSPMPRTCCMFD
ncbi:MAG: hypothetical protein IBJ12_12960 [Sphingomonadaceae bacterium]|nr:hypothetical protein [Sphingomonadaceae bacterium]